MHNACQYSTSSFLKGLSKSSMVESRRVISPSHCSQKVVNKRIMWSLSWIAQLFTFVRSPLAASIHTFYPSTICGNGDREHSFVEWWRQHYVCYERQSAKPNMTPWNGERWLSHSWPFPKQIGEHFRSPYTMSCLPQIFMEFGLLFPICKLAHFKAWSS